MNTCMILCFIKASISLYVHMIYVLHICVDVMDEKVVHYICAMGMQTNTVHPNILVNLTNLFVFKHYDLITQRCI